MKILTVVSAFDGYEKGAQISEPDAVASALDSHGSHVVVSEVPAPPRATVVVPTKSAD